MNLPPDSRDEELEVLLRRWGAEEAAQQAAARAPPMPALPCEAALRSEARAGPLPAWWARYAPLAAAAAILVAAGAVFLASRLGAPEAGIPAEGRSADLAAELAAVKGDLAQARDDLAEARGALDAERARLDAEVARLERAFEAEKAALAERMRLQTEALERLVGQHKEALDEAGADLRRAREQAREFAAALAASQNESARLRRELADKAAALATSAREAAAAREELERRLQALRDEYAGMLAAIQRVYLAAAVPGGGLDAVQAAARRSQIVRRGAEVRELARGEEARRLFDALEVVLTRMDLLDVRDPDQVESFRRLVRRGGLVERIEGLLVAGEEDARVRAWLLEARLLLVGANRVG